MRLQTCEKWWSVLLVIRRIVLIVVGTHIFDLSVGRARFELKQDDVEDRHDIVVVGIVGTTNAWVV